MQSSSGPPTTTSTSGTVSVPVAVPSSTPQSTLKTISSSMSNLPTHRVTSALPRNSASGGARPAISSASSQQSYHVPRGAAAVANIAVPRSASLVTPILRGTSSSGNSANTTTAGVGTSSTISSYAVAGGFRAPAQSQAWDATNAPRVASPGPLRSVHAAPRAPIATYTHPNRATQAASLTTTTRTTIPGRDTPRPVLHQPSVQKTASKVQSTVQTPTQPHGPEKSFLKSGVGVSLQTVRTSVAQGSQPQLISASAPHQIAVTQSPASRFSSAGPLNSSVSQPVPSTTLSQTSGSVGLATSGRTVSLVARPGGPTPGGSAPPGSAPPPNQPVPGATQSATSQAQPTMVLSTPGTLPTPVLTSAARLTSPAIISGSTPGSRLTVSGTQSSLPSQVLTGTARIMSQPGGAVISGARLPSSQGRVTYSGSTTPLVPQNTRLSQSPMMGSPVRVGAGITPTLTSGTRVSVPAGGMVSLQSMVVSNNPTIVTGTGTAPLKTTHPGAQPSGVRTLPLQSHGLSAKPNSVPSIQITSTVVSTGPTSVIGTSTCSNVSTMTSLRTVGSGTPTINTTTNTTSVTTSSKTVAAYAQTPVTLSTLSSLTSLSARPVAVQSQPISVTKVFPQGLGMVGSVGMNVGVAEVSLPVHAMQAVQATSSSQPQQTLGQATQPTSVYIQTATHRASSSPGPAGTQLTVDRSTSGYTLPTTTYYLDPSYPMSMANVTGSLVARAGTTPYAIQATAAQAVQAVRSGIGASTSQQVHSLVTNAPPVRFNPMMVVDHGRVPVHASIVSAEVDCGVRQVQAELRTGADVKNSRHSVIQQFPSSLQRPTSVVQNGGGPTGRAFISAEGNLVTTPVTSTGPAQQGLALTSSVPTTQVQSQPAQPQSLPVQSAQPVQTQQGTHPPSAAPQQTQPTKPNASPRPSILRKRDIEGSPLKAQRNLTPILAGITSGTTTSTSTSLSNLPVSLASTAPPSPPSPPKRPDSGGHHSSGSTTISATSSPGLNDLNDDSPPTLQAPSAASIAAGLHAAVASGSVVGSVAGDNLEPVVKREAEVAHEKPPVLEMSPRKKPRKQQLTGNELQEQKFSEDEMEFLSEEKLRKEPKEEHEDRLRQSQPSQMMQQQHDQPQKQQQATAAASAPREVYPKRNGLTLMSTYRFPWKSRHNHFLRHSDVRPKEERRPTVSELASQKYIQQRLNGWKVHHLTTQMENLAELEMQVCAQLGDVLKLIEKKSKKEGAEQDRDVNRVNELIKGNMQRSQVIADGMLEAKSAVMKIFEHRPRVAEIINRSSGKRTFKKREKS